MNLDEEQAAVSTTPSTLPRIDPRVLPDEFCQRMSDIRYQALIGSLPSDPQYLIDEYTEILPLAPVEVQPIMEAVILQLQSPTSTTSNAEADVSEGSIVGPTGEGQLPPVTPQGQLAAYVESYCSGTNNNPGPAATSPP